MSPASADGRKPKRVTMLEEPTGLDGAPGSTFARDSKDRPTGSGGASGPRGSAVSAGGTSPLGAELKGSVGEGSNHSNFSDRSSVSPNIPSEYRKRSC